jgi:hypothetical protein
MTISGLRFVRHFALKGLQKDPVLHQLMDIPISLWMPGALLMTTQIVGRLEMRL